MLGNRATDLLFSNLTDLVNDLNMSMLVLGKLLLL